MLRTPILLSTAISAIRFLARRGMSTVRVAIDGPAGSGKSTVAKAVALKCGLTYVDTGAMYRAVTLKAMQSGLDLKNEGGVAALAEGLDITLDTSGGTSTVSVNGQDVSSDIRLVRPPLARVRSFGSFVVAAYRCCRGDDCALHHDASESVLLLPDNTLPVGADVHERSPT